MADQDNDQKTEQPTDKKVSEAMERGQFARSQELQIVCILGAALWVLSLTTSTMATELHDLAVNVFSQLGHIRLQLDTVPTHLMSIVVVGAKLLGPVVGAGAIAALLAGGFQSGFQLTPKALEFKPERLNPVEGFQRIFSKATLVHAGIDLLKLLAIGFVLWTVAQNLMKDPIFNSPVEPAYVGDYLQRATTAFLSRLLLALGVIAAISYSYEKYKTHNDLMMSREEIKEEHRQAEGDANSKAAMRRMARRLMQRQMLAAVPTADVVVTNPTHYAVALKYERGVDAAPVVLAKGENGFAQRIKALAAENG
ncbi:MAG TPA: EscU/YscU/HrcU family type III secretion system export apparatus switch protein, partial [Opitutaceae bacterium]|nr:EscU/YscU/HrcU family type III secretion system export apparatus switch protein [Opitutaceae bacterium]